MWETPTKTPESTQNQTPESVQKKSKWFEKIHTHAKNFKKKIKKALGFLSDEEGWNEFSANQKQEMLDSLKMQDEFDLDSIAVDDIYARTDVHAGLFDWIEYSVFKESEMKKDSIWKYIEINWMKCRPWQPGITWFTYNIHVDKHYPRERLTIWFCYKWEWTKRREIKRQEYSPRQCWGDNNSEYPDYATPSGIRRIRYLEEHYDEIQQEKAEKRAKRKQKREEKRAKRKQKREWSKKESQE